MTEPEQIDPGEIHQGPIRHETLRPELLELIQSVYDLVGPYLNTTLEQFELSFMRDMHPESEIAVWCGITSAWVAYHERHLDGEVQADDVEKELLGALLLISAGVQDAEALKVPVDVGRKLLECYADLIEE